ncbi:MAG: EhaE family protein [Methanobrevibacter sp.]|jgi:energy-converting hydrogenase A subunit E|nr:EhaE family protein [Candidatus Methanoflexus mossambicus]
MFDLNIFFYFGCFLAILGSLATVWGPNVQDPIVRTFNVEIASIGVSLILLTYNHTLALLTFVTTGVAISLILLRAITRLEEMEADV